MIMCCVYCFSDKKIGLHISQIGEFIDKCSYCNAENIYAVKPVVIFEFIEKIDASFKTGEGGISLFDLVVDKLKIFSAKNSNSIGLFNSIISGNEYLLEKKYHIEDSSKTFESWLLFIDEIKSKNRFFPQTKLYKDIFSQSLNSVESESSSFFSLVETLKIKFQPGLHYYRGRTNEEKLTIDKMGMPPPHMASGGRANPVGIPYLYLAENIETCVAEIRPSNGCKINIAKYNLIKEINLLDLSEPRRKASFMVLEENEIGLSLKFIDLLEKFSLELSTPILPYNGHLDYIPTQFICEFFKTICKYDGIIFNSSFGHGKNIVLFSENFVQGEEIIDHLKVSKISHEFEAI